MKHPVSIGDLRDRVVIQQRSDASDGMGGQTPTWSELDTVWAYIEPVSANQKWHAEKLEHRVSHKVVIRGRSDVTIKHRLKFGTRIFHIQEVRDLRERGWWLEIMAEEGAPS